MAKGVNTQFTVGLNVTAEVAESQVRAAVSKLNKMLANIDTDAAKMEYFEDLVGYIGQLDRVLTVLRSGNSDTFERVFGGLDSSLRAEFESIFGIAKEKVQELNQLRLDMDITKIDGSNLETLEKWEKSIQSIYGLMGKKADIDGLGTVEERIKKCRTAVDNFGLVWEGMVDRIAHGLSGTGQGGGLGTFTEAAQQEMDALESKVKNVSSVLENLKTILENVKKIQSTSGKSPTLYFDATEESAQQLLQTLTELSHVQTKNLQDNLTDSEYTDLVRYIEAATQLIAIKGKLQEQQKLPTSLSKAIDSSGVEDFIQTLYTPGSKTKLAGKIAEALERSLQAAKERMNAIKFDPDSYVKTSGGSGTGTGDGAGGESAADEDSAKYEKLKETLKEVRDMIDSVTESMQDTGKFDQSIKHSVQTLGTFRDVLGEIESKSESAWNNLKVEPANLFNIESLTSSVQEAVGIVQQAVKDIVAEIDSLANKEIKIGDVDTSALQRETSHEVDSTTTESVHERNADAIREETAARRELAQVNADLDDDDDSEEATIRRENGQLEQKLELLREIAEEYQSNVKFSDRKRKEELEDKSVDTALSAREEERLNELTEKIDEADEKMSNLGEAYDKITLKLANGRKIDILPDDAGLRALDRIANEYDDGTYNGIDIADIVFVRKQEQAIIDQTNAKLQKQLGIQERIQNTTSSQREDIKKRYTEDELIDLAFNEDKVRQELQKNPNLVDSLVGQRDEIKNRMKPIEDAVSRISKMASIKDVKYDDLYQEAASAAQRLDSLYDDGITNTEEYIALQYKLMNIFDKLSQSAGGVKGSGAKSASELREWFMNSIKVETGFDMIGSNVIDAIWGQGKYSIFDDSNTKRTMREMAAELYNYKDVESVFDGGFGLFLDDKKLQNIGKILQAVSKIAQESAQEQVDAQDSINDSLNDRPNIATETQQEADGHHANADAIREEKSARQELTAEEKKAKSAEGQQEITDGAETKKLQDLSTAIEGVSTAIESKNTALKSYLENVNTVMTTETQSLTDLSEALGKFQTTAGEIFKADLVPAEAFSTWKTDIEAIAGHAQTIIDAVGQIRALSGDNDALQTDPSKAVDQAVQSIDFSGLIAPVTKSLGQIQTILSAFTGIKSTEEDSIEKTKPAKNAGFADQEITKAWFADLATNSKLGEVVTAISNLADAIAKKDEEQLKDREAMTKLSGSIEAATSELKTAASGIAQHQMAQGRDKQAASARLADRTTYESMRKSAIDAIGSTAIDSGIMSFNTDTDGIVNFVAWVQTAENAWSQYTIAVNEAGEATIQNVKENSKAAKRAAIEAKKILEDKDEEENPLKYKTLDSVTSAAYDHWKKEIAQGKKSRLEMKDSGRYTVSTEEQIGGLMQTTFQTFDEEQKQMSRTTITLQNSIAAAIAKTNQEIEAQKAGFNNATLLDQYTDAYAELVRLNGEYVGRSDLTDAQIAGWNQQIELVQRLGNEVATTMKQQQRMKDQAGVSESARDLAKYKADADKAFKSAGFDRRYPANEDEKGILELADKIFDKTEELQKSHAVLTDAQRKDLDTWQKDLDSKVDAYKKKHFDLPAAITERQSEIKEFESSIKNTGMLTDDLVNSLETMKAALKGIQTPEEFAQWVVDWGKLQDDITAQQGSKATQQRMEQYKTQIADMQKMLSSTKSQLGFDIYSDKLNGEQLVIAQEYIEVENTLKRISKHVGQINQDEYASAISAAQAVRSKANAYIDAAKAQKDAEAQTKAVDTLEGKKADKRIDFDKYKANIQASTVLTQALSKELERLDTRLGIITSDDEFAQWAQDYKKLQADIDVHKNSEKYKQEDARTKDAMRGMQTSLETDLKQIKSVAGETPDASMSKMIGDHEALISLIKERRALGRMVTQEELDGFEDQRNELKTNLDLHKKNNEEMYEKKQKQKRPYGTGIKTGLDAKDNALRRSLAEDGALFGASETEGNDLYDAVQKYEAARKAFQDVYNRLKTQKDVSESDETEFKDASAQVNKQRKAVEDLVSSYQKMRENMTKAPVELDDSFEDTIEGRKKALNDYMEATYGASIKTSKFNKDCTELDVVISNSDGTLTKATIALDRYNKEIVEGSKDIDNVKDDYGSLFDVLREGGQELTQFVATRFGIEEVFQMISQGVESVKELDLAMTELKKVTNESDSTYDKFIGKMSKMSGEVGSTVTDLTTMASDWARLGYSIEEAGQLAGTTAKLMNVSEFDSAEDATSALVSSLQAFSKDGVAAGQRAEQIVDVLNNIGNKYPVATSELATGIASSGAALVAANNSIEEQVAMLAAGNATIQNVNNVASGLKIVAARLRGTTTEEDDDTESAVTNVSKLQAQVKALTKEANGGQGIDILNEKGEYKSTYKILSEISNVFDKMDDMSQAGLLELIAGKNRSSVVAAVLQNGDILKNAYADAFNSEGSAARELDTYLNSIQGRIDKFNNATQTMWANFISDDVIKSVVDLGTFFIQFLDAIGPGLTTALGALAAIPAATFFKSLNQWANNDTLSFVDAMKTGFGSLKKSFIELTAKAKGSSWISSIIGFVSNPYVLAFAGVLALGTAAWDAWHLSASEAAEKVEEITKTYSDAQKTFKKNLDDLTKSSDSKLYATLQDEFNALAQGVDKYGNNISLTTDEYERYKEICDTIVSINPKIAEGYESSTKAIGNNVNMIGQLIEAQKMAARQSAAEYLNAENQKAIAKDAYTQFDNAVTKYENQKTNYDIEMGNAAFNLTEYFARHIASDQQFANVYGETPEEFVPKMLEVMGYTPDNIQSIIDQYTSDLGVLDPQKMFKDFMPEIMRKEDLFTIDGNNYIKSFFDQYGYTYIEVEKYAKDVERARDLLIDDLMNTTVESSDFEKLGDGGQKFIVEWIKNSEQFKIPEDAKDWHVASDVLKNGHQNILDMISDLANDTTPYDVGDKRMTGQDIIESLYDFDNMSGMSWDSYTGQVNTLIDGFWTAIGKESNQYGMSRDNILQAFGFDFDAIAADAEANSKLIAERFKIDETELAKAVEGMDAKQFKRYAEIDWELINPGDIDGIEGIMAEVDKQVTATKSVVKVKTYVALTTDVEQYNDILKQTAEITTDNVEVTQEYKTALEKLKIDEEALAECFDSVNPLLVTNSKQLNKLVKDTNKNVAADIKLAKAQAQLEYYELSKEIGILADMRGEMTADTLAEINSLYGEMSALQGTIAQFSALEASILGAANAYTKLAEAQAIDEANDYGTKAEELVNVLGTAFQTAKLGTKSAQTAIEGLIPEGIIDKSKTLDDQMQQIYDYFKTGKLSELFEIKTGEGGAIESVEMTKEKVEAFTKSLIDNKEVLMPDGTKGSIFTGSWDEFDLNPAIKSLSDFADACGLTEEVAFAFLSELETYDISWLGGDNETLLDQLMGDNLEYKVQKTTKDLTDLRKEWAELTSKGDKRTDAENKRLQELGGYENQIGLLQQANNQMAKHRQAALETWESYEQGEQALATLSKLNKATTLTEEQFNQLGLKEVGLEWNGNTSVKDYYDQLLAQQTLLGQPTDLVVQLAQEQLQGQLDSLEGQLGVEVEGKIVFDEQSGKYKYTGPEKLTPEQEELVQQYGETAAKLQSTQEYLAARDVSVEGHLSRIEGLLSAINKAVGGEEPPKDPESGEGGSKETEHETTTETENPPPVVEPEQQKTGDHRAVFDEIAGEMAQDEQAAKLAADIAKQQELAAAQERAMAAIDALSSFQTMLNQQLEEKYGQDPTDEDYQAAKDFRQMLLTGEWPTSEGVPNREQVEEAARSMIANMIQQAQLEYKSENATQEYSFEEDGQALKTFESMFGKPFGQAVNDLVSDFFGLFLPAGAKGEESEGTSQDGTGVTEEAVVNAENVNVTAGAGTSGQGIPYTDPSLFYPNQPDGADPAGDRQRAWNAVGQPYEDQPQELPPEVRNAAIENIARMISDAQANEAWGKHMQDFIAHTQQLYKEKYGPDGIQPKQQEEPESTDGTQTFMERLNGLLFGHKDTKTDAQKEVTVTANEVNVAADSGTTGGDIEFKSNGVGEKYDQMDITGGDDGVQEATEAVNEYNQAIQETNTQAHGASDQATVMWQNYAENDAAMGALGAMQDQYALLGEASAEAFGVETDFSGFVTVGEALDQLFAKKQEVSQPVEMTVESAVSNIDSQIASIEQMKSLIQSDWKILPEVEADLLTSLDAQIAALQAQKITLQAELQVQTSEATEGIDSVNSTTVQDKEVEVTETGAAATVGKLQAVNAEAGNVTKVVTTIYREVGGGGIGSGRTNATATVNVNGTAHAQGTAHTSGSWGAEETSTSLVGELGPELRVRDNKWSLVGTHGAEFTDIRKGDIVFNHKQTEKLLASGYITGRGKAYVEGTVGGSAFAGINTWDKAYKDTSGSNRKNTAEKLSQAAKDMSDTSDEFKEVFDWIEVRVDEITERIDLMSAKLENAIGSIDKNTIVDSMIEANKDLYDNLIAGAEKYAEYAVELLKEVPEEYREAAQDGSIAIESFTGEVGEKALEAIENYREWAQKGSDVTQQAEEVLTEISSLAKQAIDNIAEDYENKISIPSIKLDQLEAYNDLLETTLGAESEKVYQAMIEANKGNIDILESQREAMQAELDKRVAAGEIKKYSQDWYDAVNEISEVDTEIIELTTDVNELQDSINELHWDHFDNLIDRIKSISDEADSLIDILGSDDLVDKDTAEWTDAGITSLGLYAQQLESAEMQAAKYAEEIEYLNKNWKKLGYTEQEYVEKLEELKDGQYDAIKAYNDTKKAIVDLNKERIEAVKDGIQKEIDAYEELIEKKKEELDAEKDLYDFQKNVAKQQKNIADIERKLAALSNDNSASARAQRAKLQAELAEAQQELQDTYYDRSVSDQQEALDKELEAFKEEKDKEIETLEEYLENTELVISDSLATITANTDVVYQTLQTMSQEYALSLAEAITSPWAQGANALQAYSEQFGLSMSSTVDELQRLADEYKRIMGEIETAGGQVVSTVAQNVQTYQAESKKETTQTAKAVAKTISVGGKINAGSAKIYDHYGDTSGEKQYYSNDPIYDVLAIQGDWVQVRHKSQKSGITGWFKKSQVQAYANGTTGVKNSQLALIDELGEELVVRPQNGRMTFLEKGTGVIPADLTANLMEWGELDPSTMLAQNKPEIAMSPSIVNNTMEINIDASVGELIHVEHLDGNNPAEITKIVDKAWDKYMKDLNNHIRRYVK